jgi:hypothetical protein
MAGHPLHPFGWRFRATGWRRHGLVDPREGGALPQPGTAIWSGSLHPHTLENVDTSEIHVIGVGLKTG